MVKNRILIFDALNVSKINDKITETFGMSNFGKENPINLDKRDSYFLKNFTNNYNFFFISYFINLFNSNFKPIPSRKIYFRI